MKTLILLILCLTSLPAMAARTAVEGRVDPRIKTVTYNERDVVIIHGHYGYSTHIVFSPDEEIVHLSPGDSLAWQIVPKQNHLFLKPMENDANTNLSVLTNVRQYNFELRANEAVDSADTTLSFVIKFHYPQDEMLRALAKAERETKKHDTEIVPGREFSSEQLNFEYTRRGSDRIAPTRVFDDGEFTYFQFPKEINTPAIFLISRDKKEAIVNFHVRGAYVVVQRIGAQFILRDGSEATCIYNEAYQDRFEESELPEIAVTQEQE